MRFEDIYITGVGARLGRQVRTSAMVRRRAVAAADARSTRQRSVCVAAESGPELAVAAARQAVRGHEQTTGQPSTIRAHLHAQMFDKPDFWSAACYVLNQLGVTGCGVTCEIGAMSNGTVLGLEVAASLLGARQDLHTALITAGDRFAGSRFARYRAEPGVFYGDAGAAMVVSRTPGLARVVSVATVTDPVLEGLTRDTSSTPRAPSAPPTSSAVLAVPGAGTTTSSRSDVGDGGSDRSMDESSIDGVIDVRRRQRAWLRQHGGLAEALRRNRAGVMAATRIALADAGITLDQARWIVVPFLGFETVRTRWARPLGISEERPDRTLTLLGLHLGHLGAADHMVGFRHLMATGSVEPGDYVVLASAGEGMSWSTAVLQITDHREHPDLPGACLRGGNSSTASGAGSRTIRFGERMATCASLDIGDVKSPGENTP